MNRSITSTHLPEQGHHEAEAMHTVLNGLRSKLSLEGPLDEPGPSDAAVMEAVESASGGRSNTNRFNGRFWTKPGGTGG